MLQGRILAYHLYALLLDWMTPRNNNKSVMDADLVKTQAMLLNKQYLL